VVIQCGGALVEAASVPGIAEAEPQKVQMMAELMAQSAQEAPSQIVDPILGVFAAGPFRSNLAFGFKMSILLA
jgi:hypothetical protein